MYSYLLRFLGLIATVVLLYVNVEVWQFNWLSWVVLVIFFWLASSHYEGVIVERFGFRSGVRSKILGAFILLVVFGCLTGMTIVFWTLNPVSIAISLIISSFIGATLAPIEHIQTNAPVVEEVDGGAVLVDKKSYLVFFFVFAFFGFITLFLSSNEIHLFTPWQTIPGYYIYLYFLLLLLSGGIVFSNFRVSIILTVLVVQFLLAFSYLPLTHKIFWGADGWRHKAVIDSIVSGESIVIKNFSENAGWVEKINPGLFSYSQFWGILSSTSIITGLDSVYSIAWLLPLLAGILLPLLLYEIGRALQWTRRSSLFLAWFGLFPFALQMVGAFSLPVSMGFLVFLLFLLLLIRRSHEKKRGQIALLIGLIILSFFGYALFTILMIFSFAALELMNLIRFKKEKNEIFSVVIVSLCALFIIPVIELVAGYSHFNGSINYINSATQVIGNFSGYFLADGPRPHIIDTGNVFFNQIPVYAFVSNSLTSWRWWIIAFMVLFFIGAIIGLQKIFKQGSQSEKFLAATGAGLFMSYVLTRYFLTGEHILSRRLDATLAFLAILFVVASIKYAINHNKFAAMFFVLIISIGATASYSLGPYSQAMSSDEYRAAQFIWTNIKNDNNFCIVADTYPLLALEAISHKKIIGGGFPINENFAQPELGVLFEEMRVSSTPVLWQKARDLTGATYCYLIIPEQNNSSENVSLGRFGSFTVYRN